MLVIFVSFSLIVMLNLQSLLHFSWKVEKFVGVSVNMF